MSRQKSIATLAAALMATCFGITAAEIGKTTYYIQLVRGTEEATAPSANAKPIGPKIAKLLGPVFKWDHYWEIARDEISLAPVEKKLISLNPQRSVEIDLSDPAKLKVTAYEGKKAICKVANPITAPMTIIGGDRSTNSSWFMIVRRDKPAQ